MHKSPPLLQWLTWLVVSLLIMDCSTYEPSPDPGMYVLFDYTLGNSGQVKFINKSNPVRGTAYLWTFGDGTSSNETSPTHGYVTNGSYTVKLAATGPTGSGELSAFFVIDNVN